jgi:preprotein translocase subunit SecA
VVRRPTAVPASHAFDYFKRAQALAQREQKASAVAEQAPAAQAPDAAEATHAGASLPAQAENGSPAPARSAVPPPRSAQASQRAPAVPVVGRNDPCPCGSGQKYKKCHGKGD